MLTGKFKEGDAVTVREPGTWPLRCEVVEVDTGGLDYDMLKLHVLDAMPVPRPDFWVSEKWCETTAPAGQS